MLAWAMTLAAHISMRRRMTPAETAALVLRAPGGATASLLALLAIIAVMISTWWVPRLRIAIVSGGPYMVVLSIAYLFVRSHYRGTEKFSSR